MECAVLGWPPDGPKLELDWRSFSYAGKFVMTNTGKMVAREDGEIVGAVAFNADRTDEKTAWLRYVTVREDRRGTGVGPELISFTTDQLLDAAFERVRIAVNNPFAYVALYKADFAYTGEQTGIAELVLEHPAEAGVEAYRAGLKLFADRDLSSAEESFLEEKLAAGQPPQTV